MALRTGSMNKRYFGEVVHSAKLTEDDVRLIDALLQEGLSMRKIGDKFGVTAHAVWAISNGKSWKHITGARSA